jgi:hypothetical protein
LSAPGRPQRIRLLPDRNAAGLVARERHDIVSHLFEAAKALLTTQAFPVCPKPGSTT